MMEEFTSQDPEVQEEQGEIITESQNLWDQSSDQEIYDQEVNLFLSDQEDPIKNQLNQDANLLNEVRQIKDLLKESSVETSSEVTTDYVQMIYSEVKHQNENLDALQSSLLTIGKDQQTIGVLSVGATILLIGALGVFFFLWRVR